MQKVSVHVLGPIQDMLARPHPASASTFFLFFKAQLQNTPFEFSTFSFSFV